jgi:superoxide reductase
MVDMNAIFQTADWKTEKHVPVIEIVGTPKKGETVKVSVCVGKQIPHPNKSEHFIAWIELYFLAEGEKNAYQLGRFEFDAHGVSAKGPETSTVYMNPEANISFKTEKNGILMAFSFCNIHGLWRNELPLKIG